MVFNIMLLSALACDYGILVDNAAVQDGQTLGLRSVIRLEKMWEGARFARTCGVTDPVFIFSAGRLNDDNARLCDLQSQWVKQRWWEMSWGGSPLIICPHQTDRNVWGTEAELSYLAEYAKECANFGDVSVEVSTEAYHARRTAYLMQCVGLKADLQIVDSDKLPPTKKELWHEQRSYYARRYLPTGLMERVRDWSRQAKT